MSDLQHLLTDPPAAAGSAAPFGDAAALVVVDFQNDFADPRGSLHVRGGEALAPGLNATIAEARAAGALVVYTQDWHPEHTPHFAADGGAWPVHCVQGTWGAELHPALSIVGPVVRKGANGEDGYSGFTMRDPLGGGTVPTELDALLRARGVRRVVVCGLATDYCVVETGMDALAAGYETIVLADAVRAVDLQPGDGEAALRRLADAGARIVRPVATSGDDGVQGTASGTASGPAPRGAR